MESKHGLKRSDMGLAGAIIILAQVLSGMKSTQSVSQEIEKLRDNLRQLQSDQEQFFVRKKELKKVVIKLDQMNDHLAEMSDDIKSFEKRLSHHRQVGITSCSLKVPEEEGE